MALLELFFPPICSLCGRERETEERTGVCWRCRSTLDLRPVSPEARCPVCFHPMSKNDDCPFCSDRNVFFDTHRSLYSLNAPLHRILQVWKFENERIAGRLFFPGLIRILSELHFSSPVRFVYIRSGRSSLNLRNYQPCEDLARQAVKQIPGSSHGGDLRKKKVRKQSRSRYRDRFLEMHESLALCRKPEPDETLVLVEDLFTTGATANEAARILKNNGASRVHLISMLYHEGHQEVVSDGQTGGEEFESSGDISKTGSGSLYRESA